MEKRIDLILHSARNGEENMSLDREALKRAERGEASLRIYRWDRPTVSLGKSQKPEDVAEIFPGLPVVVRPSGGGAVLHGFDVTVALALPLTLLELQPRALRETYVRMIAPLTEAIGACGLPGQLAEDRADRATPDCFASSGRMDLLHKETGKKVAGCALSATREAALLHASIPLISLPNWLRVDLRTRERYTNPPWKGELFPRALAATMRQMGFRVDLVSLDPQLSPSERAQTVLWNDVDPIGVNDEASAADEYDDYTLLFATATTKKDVEEALTFMRRVTRRGSSVDLERLLARLRGFSSGG